MRELSAWAIALMLIGCTAQAQLPSSAPSPTTITSEVEPQQQGRFKLRLTLSSPEDLKVREGDPIAAGQVLADRVRDRQRLETQKEQLQLQITQLQSPIAPLAAEHPVPEVAALPSPSFLGEVAEVERVKTLVTKAEKSKELAQRKLDLLQSLPRAEVPEATIPHETEVLAEKGRDLDQMNAELELAKAKLGKAQKDREYQEYLHSLELSQRAIAIEQANLQRQSQVQKQAEQLQARSFQLAQLTAQMQALEAQLVSLSAIRSPYAGTVQRIKVEGQTDQALAVELVLVISHSSRSGANADRGASATSDAVSSDGATAPTRAAGDGTR
jgi:multidrug efflux pump subunit AcrA (membrane-fusion protein)